MAVFPSSDAVFQINDGTTLRDISPYILSIDGLPVTRELKDATGLNVLGRAFYPTLQNTVITLELLWSKDASVGPDLVFGAIFDDTAVRAWDWGPEGKVTGDIKYSGNCWLRAYTTPTIVGDLLKAHVELQVDGVVTRGTYA